MDKRKKSLSSSAYGFVLIISSLCIALYFPLLWNLRPKVDHPSMVNVNEIIRPDTETTIICPLICNNNNNNNSNNKTAINSLTETDNNIFLLVVVFSACGNFVQRQAIRDTWSSLDAMYSKPMPFPSRNSKLPIENSFEEQRRNRVSTVRVVFLLGHDTNSTVRSLIEAESGRYRDIVVEDFHDTYQNLTIKTIMMLKWILTQNCDRLVDYVLKTDDDTFVNVPQLLKYLTNNHETLSKRSALIGVRICKARVVRNIYDKWYVHPDLITNRYYSDYLSGSGYVIPRNTIRRLYAATRVSPFLFIEDVYLTSICARNSDIELIGAEGFTALRLPLDPCVFHYVVTAHHVTSDQMRTIWKEMKQDWNVLNCGQVHYDIRNRQTSYCSSN